MKRILARIGRFFGSRGFLKFCLWTITLIILFYVEENWRGARMWVATKAKWEAKGESLDYYGTFIPPVIPDANNLAAIPLFKMEVDAKWPKDPNLYALKRAMRGGPDKGDTPPPMAHWQLGEVNNPEKLQHDVAAEYTTYLNGVRSPEKPFDQFEEVFSFLPALRDAAKTRSEFRLAIDYSINPPAERALGPVASMLQLSKILTFDAILALNEHRSDVALQDLKVNLQIAAGIKQDPTLVAGLVAMGMTAVGNGAIFNGLARHQWSDANLAELDHLLGSINFLSDGQFDMRSEAAEAVANIEYYRHSKWNIYDLLEGMDDNGNSMRAPFWMFRLSPPWAAGWWDQNKSQVADSILPVIHAVDPQKHRAYPEIGHAVQNQNDRAKRRLLAYAPWNMWTTVAVGPVDEWMEKFPTAQVFLDEVRIACALERYRLAHGGYPDSLEALTPTYLGELPRDVITGEPYHYSLRTDDTFLLYSVGWNQSDDGGKAAYKDNKDAHQKVIDYDHGDWVWPTPQMSPEKSP